MAARFLLFFFTLLLLAHEISAGKKLIVVLVDGFKWDLIKDTKLDLKGIPKIVENGVVAPYVNPVYPSLSYPNWYSIVTGLYPESHGIVNNIMYDNTTGEVFLMVPEKGSTDPHWWNGAEPIWVTAEKQGKNVAMYWWAGCEVEIKGIHPMICERHRYGPVNEEEKADYFERIDDIIEMFKPSGMDRLSLVLMFYGAVDYAGRYSLPGTPETQRALQEIDEILYKMLRKIEKAELQKEVNLMVLSGHGMTNVRQTTTKHVDLEKFSSLIKYQISYGSTTMLVAEEGMLDKLYKDLKEATITGIKVFKKEEIPDSYHLKKSPMVNDIFIEAKNGYYIKALNDSTKRLGKYPEQYFGDSGYDPEDVKDMRTIFFATGPEFRKGYTSEPLSNIDFYNMMCTVLHIQPLSNNGSVEILKHVLVGEDVFHPATKSVNMSIHRLSFISLYCVLTLIFFSYKYH